MATKKKRKTTGKKQKKSIGKRFLLVLVITLIMLPVLFFSLIFTGFFGPIPSSEELALVRNYNASQIYSADGKRMGTYYLQNRTEVDMEQVNPVMIDALLAIEDIRFYEHNGIDYRALFRVFFRTILLNQDAGGGSTITQQLAKNLYPREKHGTLHLVADKFREMIIATRLEKINSKDDILQMYLNTVSFGEEIYGIDMASRRFFNKAPANLELEEAATLAGMLRATTWYNPHRNPKSSTERRNVVIRQMEKYGFINQEEADTAIATELETNYSVQAGSLGSAAYFREYIRLELAELLKTQEPLDGKSYNLYSDGLVIHTTLDSRVQEAAEHAVETQMKYLQSIYDGQNKDVSIFADMGDPAVIRAWQNSDHYKQLKIDGLSDAAIDSILYEPTKHKVFSWDGYSDETISPYDLQRHYLSFLQAGFLAMHPNTGEVLAWVGGINHAHFKYDHVTSSRQPGSSFKPFIYAAAMEGGLQPCDYQRNVLTVYEDYDEWMPKNANDEYGGRYSVQAALASSINTITVEVLMDNGIQNTVETIRNLGITSPIPQNPSIALGTAEVSLLEMTAAYTSFLNRGKPVMPRLIQRIYNSQGELIYNFTSEDELSATRTDVEGTSPEIAGAIVQILKKAVNEGTGRYLRSQFGITHELAGKTGTTQQFTDGWFIGMAPDLVFGSWVGGATPRVRLRHNFGYASQTALPLSGHFLSKLNQNPELTLNGKQILPADYPYAHTFQCEDFRNDRFQDRVTDFFRGNKPEAPRAANIETEEKERRNIFQRIGSIFSRDDN